MVDCRKSSATTRQKTSAIAAGDFAFGRHVLVSAAVAFRLAVAGVAV